MFYDHWTINEATPALNIMYTILHNGIYFVYIDYPGNKESKLERELIYILLWWYDWSRYVHLNKWNNHKIMIVVFNTINTLANMFMFTAKNESIF